jgi:hypothetical protein
MALKDRFEKEAIKLPCAYVNTVNSMPEADQKALAEAWANGISRRVILRVLRAEGYKTSNEAIMAHRSGTCKCPK